MAHRDHRRTLGVLSLLFCFACSRGVDALGYEEFDFSRPLRGLVLGGAEFFLTFLDTTTGAPVEGAAVEMGVGTDTFALELHTNHSGAVHVPNLGAGGVHVRVRHPDYDGGTWIGLPQTGIVLGLSPKFPVARRPVAHPSAVSPPTWKIDVSVSDLPERFRQQRAVLVLDPIVNVAPTEYFRAVSIGALPAQFEFSGVHAGTRVEAYLLDLDPEAVSDAEPIWPGGWSTWRKTFGDSLPLTPWDDSVIAATTLVLPENSETAVEIKLVPPDTRPERFRWSRNEPWLAAADAWPAQIRSSRGSVVEAGMSTQLPEGAIAEPIFDAAHRHLSEFQNEDLVVNLEANGPRGRALAHLRWVEGEFVIPPVLRPRAPPARSERGPRPAPPDPGAVLSHVTIAGAGREASFIVVNDGVDGDLARFLPEWATTDAQRMTIWDLALDPVDAKEQDSHTWVRDEL